MTMAKLDKSNTSLDLSRRAFVIGSMYASPGLTTQSKAAPAGSSVAQPENNASSEP